MIDPLKGFEELANWVDWAWQYIQVTHGPRWDEGKQLLTEARASMTQALRDEFVAGASDGWTTRMYSEKPWNENKGKLEVEAARRNP
jgi:hypothetical protein